MAESTSWTDFLLGFPPQLQGIAVLGAGIAIGYLVYMKYLRQLHGEGPQATDFAAVVGNPTALYDMGPVKELVEQAGLLVQQQVRTNLALEACAVAMQKATAAYEGHLEAEATQEAIEERAQALFERRLSETGRPVRRKPPERES